MDQQSSDAVVDVDGLDAVGAVLRQYAGRGVFSAYRMERRKPGVAEYHFGWLYGQPFTLGVDLAQRRLALVDLLPGVVRDSMMHKELRAFLKGRAAADVPAHRRVDPQLATATARLRDGIVSLELALEGGGRQDYEYGAGKIINLAHELFLFMNEYWADYMWENFRLNME
ncbi:hypothetical protein [Rugamonas sp.]|uniref:hypothetical protein n=1 Tax=Rugamonas sp. TaxID=1926287 RepID=UPI0025EA1189|nr:hypothetical protein [Rugamonas sp.]